MDEDPGQVWALERTYMRAEAEGLKPKNLLRADWKTRA